MKTRLLLTRTQCLYCYTPTKACTRARTHTQGRVYLSVEASVLAAALPASSAPPCLLHLHPLSVLQFQGLQLLDHTGATETHRCMVNDSNRVQRPAGGPWVRMRTRRGLRWIPPSGTRPVGSRCGQGQSHTQKLYAAGLDSHTNTHNLFFHACGMERPSETLQVERDERRREGEEEKGREKERERERHTGTARESERQAVGNMK